jgi:hypothetical protein
MLIAQGATSFCCNCSDGYNGAVSFIRGCACFSFFSLQQESRQPPLLALRRRMFMLGVQVQCTADFKLCLAGVGWVRYFRGFDGNIVEIFDVMVRLCAPEFHLACVVLVRRHSFSCLAPSTTHCWRGCRACLLEGGGGWGGYCCEWVRCPSTLQPHTSHPPHRIAPVATPSATSHHIPSVTTVIPLLPLSGAPPCA